MMRKPIALAALLAASAAAAPALAQQAVVAAPGPAVVAAPVPAPAFRQMAMAGDTFEIESSRLALERSRNPRVREFAEMMIQHHSMTTSALNGGTPVAGGALGGAAAGAIVGGVVGGPVGAAVGAGVGATAGATADVATTAAVPRYAPGPTLDAQKADMLNQLAMASGRQFDRLYGRMQRQAHEEAIAMYTAYAQGGTDPALRNFAQQALPVLQDHYAEARRLPR